MSETQTVGELTTDPATGEQFRDIDGKRWRKLRGDELGGCYDMLYEGEYYRYMPDQPDQAAEKPAEPQAGKLPEIDVVRHERDEYRKANEVLRDELADATKSRDEWRAAFEVEAKAIGSLRMQLATEQLTREELVNRVEVLTLERDENYSKFLQMEETNLNNVANYQLQITELTAERDTLTASVAEMQTELGKLKDHLRDFDRMRGERDIYQREAMELKTELVQTIENKDNHIRALNEANDILKREIEISQSNCREAKEELTDIATIIEACRDVNDGLDCCDAIAAITLERDSALGQLAKLRDAAETAIADAGLEMMHDWTLEQCLSQLPFQVNALRESANMTTAVATEPAEPKWRELTRNETYSGPGLVRDYKTGLWLDAHILHIDSEAEIYPFVSKIKGEGSYGSWKFARVPV
jgi:hypothetical protein